MLTWTWQQRRELGHHKPRDNKDARGPPEAKREAWDRRFHGTPEGTSSASTRFQTSGLQNCARIHACYFKPAALLHVVTSALGGPHGGSWEDGLSECTMAVLRVGLAHNEHYLSSSSYYDFGLLTFSYFIILLWKILSLGEKKVIKTLEKGIKQEFSVRPHPASPGIPDKVHRHFLLSQDIGWKGVLLVSSVGRPGRPLNTPQYTRRPPMTKSDQTQKSIMYVWETLW